MSETYIFNMSVLVLFIQKVFTARLLIILVIFIEEFSSSSLRILIWFAKKIVFRNKI